MARSDANFIPIMTDPSHQSVFQLLLRHDYLKLSIHDDLTSYLVLLVQTTLTPNNNTVTNQPIKTHSETIRFDPPTATHVFQLLGRYKQVNRIKKYLELDVSSIWDQVKRQSRYALTTLSEAEKIEQDLISFERGDQETRVRLILSQLHQLIRNIRHKPKPKSVPSTPVKPPVLARVSSSLTPAATAAASSTIHYQPTHQFQSALLTNELFSDEIQQIIPVLFLQCFNAPSNPSTSGHDEMDDSDSDMESSHVEPASDDQIEPPSTDSSSSSFNPTSRSPFMSLHDLVQVLLYQGPIHGARLLTLLAATKPFQLSALLDVCFQQLEQQLSQLAEKLTTMSLTLTTVLHHHQHLSTAAQQIWQCGWTTLHSAPFTTFFAFFNAVAQLAPTPIGLFVRLRISKMMEQVKLIPPTLTLPIIAPPTTAAGSTITNSPALPPSTPSTTAASSSSTPTVTATPHARPRAPAPPQPPTPNSNLVRTPTSASATSAAASSASWMTPAFVASLLANSWAPITHFLPSLAMSVTLSAIRDELTFLFSLFNQLNSSRQAEDKSASQLLIDYIRDFKLSEDYSDVVATAVHTAHVTATAAATAALHAQASKARDQAAETSRKRKGGSSENSQSSRATTATSSKERNKGSTTGTPSSSAQSKTPFLSGARGSTPNTSPTLTAQKLPSVALGSPNQKGLLTSPTLQSQQMRELLLTPNPTRKGATGSLGSPSIGPRASSSSPNSARASPSGPVSIFQSGSVHALRATLLTHLERLLSSFHQQLEKGVNQLQSGTLIEFNRLVTLYSYLLLYANFFLRSAEIELLLTLVPDTVAPLDGITSQTLLLLSQLFQSFLVFLCISPQLSLTSQYGSRAIWNQTQLALERLKPWMKAIQTSQRAMAASTPQAVVSFNDRKDSFLCENLLVQIAILGHIQRPSDYPYLLRALLRLPAHFKPGLLLPYSDRVTPHMKEVQHAICSGSLWTKFELMSEVFTFNGNEASLCIRDPVTNLYVLRSSSPYLSHCFSHQLTNIIHLIRSNPSQSHSHIPRPFFEFHLGFWLKQMLLVCGRIDVPTPDQAITLTSPRPSLHPLLTHPNIFHLLDSLIQFDLSTAILEQLHGQPTQPSQHKPCVSKTDIRLLKQHEMKELLETLSATSGAHPTSSLPNPIGFALVVYYYLYYNSLVFYLWSKCIPSTPTSGWESKLQSYSQLLTAKDSSSNYATIYQELGLPPPPFPATNLATSVSIASALLPYPPNWLYQYPIRPLLDTLKSWVLKKEDNKNPTLDANLSKLFFNIYQLLYKLYPEFLIGIDISACDPPSNTPPSEGSLSILGIQPAEMESFFLTNHVQPALNSFLREPCSFDCMLLNPMDTLLLAKPEILWSPTGLRPFLVHLFYLLVASTSYYQFLSKSEYVSMQIVRQATYHACYTEWTKAMRIMGNNTTGGGTSNEKRSSAAATSVIHSDPIVLTLHKSVEKASRDLFRLKEDSSVSTTTTAPNKLSISTESTEARVTNADTDGKVVKKMKGTRVEGMPTVTPVSTPTHATATTSSTATAAAQEAHVIKVEDVEMVDEHKTETAVTTAPSTPSVSPTPEVPPSTTSVGGSHITPPSPRPFPFLVSDRLLTPGEQLIFSNDVALADPNHPPTTTPPVTSPTLQTFIYLLTTRVGVAQRILDQANILLMNFCGEDILLAYRHKEVIPLATLQMNLQLIFSFLRLLFNCSTPVGATSPSSLFLLLHVQSYPPELIPIFFHHFSPLIQQLLNEPIIKQRICMAQRDRKEPGDVTTIPVQDTELFVDLLLLYAACDSSSSPPTATSLTSPQLHTRLQQIWRAWSRQLSLFPTPASRVIVRKGINALGGFIGEQPLKDGD